MVVPVLITLENFPCKLTLGIGTTTNLSCDASHKFMCLYYFCKAHFTHIRRVDQRFDDRTVPNNSFKNASEFGGLPRNS